MEDVESTMPEHDHGTPNIGLHACRKRARDTVADEDHISSFKRVRLLERSYARD